MSRKMRTGIERWPLATPFRISRGVKTVAEVVSVELRDGNHVGRGESVPYARYGETSLSVEAQLSSVVHAVARGASRSDLPTMLPPGAARNALDCALWDLEAASSGRSVSEVTGWGEPDPIVTALTVSLDTPEKMSAAAAAMGDADLIKIKVDASAPDLAIRAVRAAAPHARLIVDPNESWDLALLAAIQPLLTELRVDFVEQPLPAGEDAGLEGFVAQVPICADESCHTADDLEVLSRRYQMINIKLDKTGGLTGALELYAAARARNFGVMVGCMVSTSLSIAPALHVAARADYVDLDGPLWLATDRPGGVTMQSGKMVRPDPGFWGAAAR
ncbi:MAG: L-Ala-D/L-Glu epimerase [Sphingomonadales bacterium]|nr:MAG: L-Ala-D/L-Glu epimerase [Sphingomonadales bacterium]